MRIQWFIQFFGMLSLVLFPVAPLLLSARASAALPFRSPMGEPISRNELSFWNNARDNNPPVPPESGGSRGDAICLLAPVQSNGEILETAMLWSDRPLFLWRGAIARIEVVAPTGEVIWHTTTWDTPAPNVYTRLYDGPLLQPDVRYTWKAYRVYAESAPNPTLTIPFQLMSDQSRQQLSGELAAFDIILGAEQVSADQRSLSYISFFAERSLWAEALRVAFTTESASEALERYQQRVLETCDR